MNETLGLLYGTVELAPYTAEWASLFREEAARLRRALSPWPCRVEHVGSTAVPGLAAKPILDIAVGGPPGVAAESVVAALVRLGYAYRGDAGAGGGHVLVRESAPGVRTHHLHVVGLGGEQWGAYLALQDWLRQSVEARGEYLRAKRALAALHGNDRRAYTRGKGEVIGRLLAQSRRG